MMDISRPKQDVYELIRKVSATRTTVLPLGLQQAETPVATHLWPKLKAVSLWAPTVFWQ